jgi:TRAP-type C4-dicarboxylate transport system permease large subunit
MLANRSVTKVKKTQVQPSSVRLRGAGISFERCAAATMPFLFPLVVVLILITFIPSFSMWLPTLIYR